jgi:hypothetical protein
VCLAVCVSVRACVCLDVFGEREVDREGEDTGSGKRVSEAEKDSQREREGRGVNMAGLCKDHPPVHEPSMRRTHPWVEWQPQLSNPLPRGAALGYRVAAVPWGAHAAWPRAASSSVMPPVLPADPASPEPAEWQRAVNLK